MADTTIIADAGDPRLQPHTEHWVRYGDDGKVMKVSSLALPRLLDEGWQEVAGISGAPLARVPGLPDAVAPEDKKKKKGSAQSPAQPATGRGGDG